MPPAVGQWPGQLTSEGPVSLQPGRLLHMPRVSSHCSLFGALCGASSSHADRGLCLRQACWALHNRGYLRGPSQQQLPGLGSGAL